jgi:hypothetical protein
MRLWQNPKIVSTPDNIINQNNLSPLDGYRHSVDPTIATYELVLWFARQAWASFQQGKEPTMLKVVREAIISCIDGAQDLFFDPKRGELILTLEDNPPQPFNYLSDGQRCILAMVADIAQKAVMLNPHMGDKVLQNTEGGGVN